MLSVKFTPAAVAAGAAAVVFSRSTVASQSPRARCPPWSACQVWFPQFLCTNENAVPAMRFTWTSASRTRRLCQDRPGPMNESWHGTRCSPRRWVRDRLLRHPRLSLRTADYSKHSHYCSQLQSYVTSRCRELRQHEPSTRWSTARRSAPVISIAMEGDQT